MTAADAIEIIKLLTDHGIVVHVDGGWGVDVYWFSVNWARALFR